MHKIISIILNRLADWTEYNRILSEFQAGFRNNYSSIENIFNLVNIVYLKRNNKNTYPFFQGFSCAFDKIPRNSLFYKLSSLGLSSKIIKLLQRLYQNNVSFVWNENSYSDPFIVKIAVKQGCIVLLFFLYINDLDVDLLGGLDVPAVNVKILLCADDLVIL